MDTDALDSSPGNQRLSEILGAYLEAVDAGWAPAEPELLARYPDQAQQLIAFLASQDYLVRWASPWRPAGAARLPANGPPASKVRLPEGAEPSTEFAEDFRPAPPAGNGRQSLANYELFEEIGKGGMGVVYKARQILPNRMVALKMIRAGRFAGPDEVRRFYDEAEAVAHLDHPHIVPLYEVGEHQGRPYFSMKLFEAGSLSRHLSRLNKDLRAAARLLATVARAIHHAHQRGILHRDLKPGNILLDAQDQPHVADFGLAKRLAKAELVDYPSSASTDLPCHDTPHEPAGPTTEFTMALTPGPRLLTPAIAGTPSYMAPEQATGRKKALTTVTDVYSLGAVLYQILTGRPPFQGATQEETLLQVQQLPPQRPRAFNPRIDRNLEAVCLKCLEKDPAKRYASAQALAEDLERWLRREPVQARRQP